MTLEKELSQISWQVPEATYRQDPALSYSTLAKFEREGYDKLSSLFDSISTPALTEGSMLDTLITGSQEEFNEQFFVADFPSIGEKELQVVLYLFNLYGSQYTELEEIPSTYILDALNVSEFQKNWKDETRVRVITERCSQYYRVKGLAEGKTVVSQDTYNKILAMVRALKESPATCGYFSDNDELSPIRRYYQLKFKATFDDVQYRCMADLLVVDYVKKEITPVDLKSSGHQEWHFEESFLKWSYMIQSRLYWRIIRANMDADPYFKDFTLKDYKFNVVNKNALTPLVWEFPMTKEFGTLVDDKDNEYRDPFEIGKELRGYLDCKPLVPNGINKDGVNIIKCLRKKE